MIKEAIFDRQQKVKGGERVCHLSNAKKVENKSPARTFLLVHYPVCSPPARSESPSSAPNGIVCWRCQECKSGTCGVSIASSQSDSCRHCTWEMHVGEIDRRHSRRVSGLMWTKASRAIVFHPESRSHCGNKVKSINLHL